MTIVLCNLDLPRNAHVLKEVGMFTRCDLRLFNRRTLISVYPYWLDTLALII